MITRTSVRQYAANNETYLPEEWAALVGRRTAVHIASEHSFVLIVSDALIVGAEVADDQRSVWLTVEYGEEQEP